VSSGLTDEAPKANDGKLMNANANTADEIIFLII
jgi:hypothetical protein